MLPQQIDHLHVVLGEGVTTLVLTHRALQARPFDIEESLEILELRVKHLIRIQGNHTSMAVLCTGIATHRLLTGAASTCVIVAREPAVVVLRHHLVHK